jgi:leucyl aminopeptidase
LIILLQYQSPISNLQSPITNHSNVMTTYALATEKSSYDCLIVPVFQDEKKDMFGALDTEQFAFVSRLRELKDFEGKKMEQVLLYTKDAKHARVLFVGLGKEKDCTARTWRQAIGASVILLQGKKCSALGVYVPTEIKKVHGPKQIAKLTTIAIETASYAFDEHKSDADARVTPVKSVVFTHIAGAEKKSWMSGVEEGKKIAEAVNGTRHLANTPPSIMTPTVLAKASQAVGKTYPKIKVTVLEKAEVKKIGMGCFLGVAQGSVQDPKFIVLEYRAGKTTDKPTVLVGKGITFDSGGLSLKPEASMCDMKFDMLGAATVLGTIRAAAALGLKKNLIGLMPTCENMPSGTAYRPDDILVNMEGKTVEVANTDAEGRLILCDALSYAKKYKPKEVIDFATLTGACVVAVGNERSGLFSPVESMVEKITSASVEVGEQLWRLPLGDEFSDAMKSDVADIKNLGSVGGGRGYGGASTAAAFLEYFTKDFKTGEPAYPWAHIDLSSSYYSSKGKPWIRGGANGFGIETMIEYLR